MSDDQSLPCPFCGSSLISDGEVLSEVNGNTFAQSECLECGALGPKGETVGPDYGDERAIAAWNQRAPWLHSSVETLMKQFTYRSTATRIPEA